MKFYVGKCCKNTQKDMFCWVLPSVEKPRQSKIVVTGKHKLPECLHIVAHETAAVQQKVSSHSSHSHTQDSSFNPLIFEGRGFQKHLHNAQQLGIAYSGVPGGVLVCYQGINYVIVARVDCRCFWVGLAACRNLGPAEGMHSLPELTEAVPGDTCFECQMCVTCSMLCGIRISIYQPDLT